MEPQSDRRRRVSVPRSAGECCSTDTYRPLQRLVSDSRLAAYTYDLLDRLLLADDGTTRTRFRYVGQTTAIAQTVNDQTGAVIVSIGVDWTGEHCLDWTGSGQNVRFNGISPGR